MERNTQHVLCTEYGPGTTLSKLPEESHLMLTTNEKKEARLLSCFAYEETETRQRGWRKWDSDSESLTPEALFLTTGPR